MTSWIFDRMVYVFKLLENSMGSAALGAGSIEFFGSQQAKRVSALFNVTQNFERPRISSTFQQILF